MTQSEFIQMSNSPSYRYLIWCIIDHYITTAHYFGMRLIIQLALMGHNEHSYQSQ